MAVAYIPGDVLPGQAPDGMIIRVVSSDLMMTRHLSLSAAQRAKEAAPKSSGASARGIEGIYGPGWFGIRWEHPYLWYQDQGIGPYTMHSLKGKVIPMWVEDEDGSEASKIPSKDRVKRTRTTVDGRRQVLIFRKATKPGAPGRIGKRTRSADGRIAKGNVGVKWRHPGLPTKGFLSDAVSSAVSSAVDSPVPHGEVQPVSLRRR